MDDGINSTNSGLDPENEQHAEVERLARLYLDREVIACQSSLIEDLFRVDCLLNKDLSDFTYENIENRTRPVDPPYFKGFTYEECSEYLENSGQECRFTPLGPEEDFGAAVLTGMRNLCQEVFDEADPEMEDQEIFEWWLVTGWLCGKLRELGEPVIDNAYGQWWGRTTTGQGIIMDGTLQEIAATYLSR